MEHLARGLCEKQTCFVLYQALALPNPAMVEAAVMAKIPVLFENAKTHR